MLYACRWGIDEELRTWIFSSTQTLLLLSWPSVFGLFYRVFGG